MAKPNTTGSPEIVHLTFEQVQEFFPHQLQKYQENYDECLRLAKEEPIGGIPFDPDEPGQLPPSECVWTLQKGESEWENKTLPDFPGYVLHAYDEEAIASYSGGGSDMSWNGDEWEM